MQYNYILDPQTGNNVQIHSIRGKNIITRYINHYQKGGILQSILRKMSGFKKKSKVVKKIQRDRSRRERQNVQAERRVINNRLFEQEFAGNLALFVCDLEFLQVHFGGNPRDEI